METKEIIQALRTKQGLSQNELAERVHVTRQAVSRWENGETMPNVETLKLLSPRTLVCQCCGMPLEDGTTSREPDGAFNEDYCKWCYAGGRFAYADKASLLDFLVAHMPNPESTAEDVRRAQFDGYLSTLKHWKDA